MKAAGPEISVRTKKKKLSIILAITGLCLLVTFIILLVIPPLIPDAIFIVLIMLLAIDLLIITILLLRFYYQSWVLIGIIIVGLIFRTQHWPLTGAFFYLGFGGLSCYSLGLAVFFISRFKHNPFLRYFGFSSSIVLAAVSVGLLFKNMHLVAGEFFLYAGVILFIVLLFAFIFTMPASNFVNWSNDERRVFFTTIIFPMVFLFLISAMMVVFPELWTTIMKQPITPFWMEDFNLLDKPGLY